MGPLWRPTSTRSPPANLPGVGVVQWTYEPSPDHGRARRRAGHRRRLRSADVAHGADAESHSDTVTGSGGPVRHRRRSRIRWRRDVDAAWSGRRHGRRPSRRADEAGRLRALPRRRDQPRLRRQRAPVLDRHGARDARLGAGRDRDRLHARGRRPDGRAGRFERPGRQRRQRDPRARDAVDPVAARLRGPATRRGARAQHGRVRDHRLRRHARRSPARGVPHRRRRPPGRHPVRRGAGPGAGGPDPDAVPVAPRQRRRRRAAGDGPAVRGGARRQRRAARRACLRGRDARHRAAIPRCWAAIRAWYAAHGMF